MLSLGIELILLNVWKSLNIIAMSKFLIPKDTLSKWTASISLMSITKKGNSLMAIKQFFVGLILTTDLIGQPQKWNSLYGISNSMGEFVFSDWFYTNFEKLKNFYESFFLATRSLSSSSSSSRSFILLFPPLPSISSAAIPDSLKNQISVTFLLLRVKGIFKEKWTIEISSS